VSVPGVDEISSTKQQGEESDRGWGPYSNTTDLLYFHEAKKSRKITKKNRTQYMQSNVVRPRLAAKAA